MCRWPPSAAPRPLSAVRRPQSAVRSLITPLRERDVLEVQRLLVEDRSLPSAGVFPRRHVGESVIVPQCLAVRRLMFHAEMAAARLFPVQRVETHQLRQFQEISDTSRVLERLIQLLAGHGYV